MLTLEQVKEINFRTGLRGYAAGEVEDFIDEVISTLEQFKKEKSELISKMNILVSKIEEYRKDEESVKNAFINTQKAADAAMREAKENAEKLVSEAKAEALRIEQEADKQLAIKKKNLVIFEKEAAKFRGELMNAYKNHIKIIDALPTDEGVDASIKQINERFPTFTDTSALSSSAAAIFGTAEIKEEKPKKAITEVIEEPDDTVVITGLAEESEDTDKIDENTSETPESLRTRLDFDLIAPDITYTKNDRGRFGELKNGEKSESKAKSGTQPKE